MRFLIKVKILEVLKGSLDLIPSPSSSVKIQIVGGKICLKCKGKTLLGDVSNFFLFSKFFYNAQQCFALLPQVNSPAQNLNFY